MIATKLNEQDKVVFAAKKNESFQYFTGNFSSYNIKTGATRDPRLKSDRSTALGWGRVRTGLK